MSRLGYCMPCGERGNPVDATVMVDGDPMCQPCSLMVGRGDGSQAAPVAAKKVEAAPVQRESEARMNKGRISEEIKAKVRAEFGAMSNEALGAKYGISGVSVGSICKGMPGGHARAKVQKVDCKMTWKPIEKAVAPTPAVPVVAALPPPPIPAAELVTLQVPAEALDRMFLSLDLAAKARAVQYLIHEGVV